MEIHTDNPRPAEENTPLVETVVEKAPPWLFSTAIHFVLMIVLALLVYKLPPQTTREIIVQPAIELDEAPKIFNVKLGDPNQPVSPVSVDNPNAEPVEIPILSPDLEGDELPQNVGPDVEDPNTLGIGTEDPKRTPIRSLIEGRSEHARGTAMFNGGGDETTEMAVLRGLHWLARQQYSKGYWSLLRGPRNHSFDATTVDNRVAATGMALLAFQGHGETRERGQFKENVERGWNWLLLEQDDDGCFYRPDPETQAHLFYTQGICTIAICELYAMTADPSRKEELRLSAQKAIDFCVNNQTSGGGWKYGRNDFESDLSVTGWIVMALHSGRIAGLEVPQETLDRVTAFLDDITEGGSKYPYQKDMNVTRSMTAEGLLCRQFLGWDRDDPRLLEGANWLIQPENLICFTGRDEMNRRNKREVYYWYYATQMFHNFGGRHWKTWNDAMMQPMCENQVTKKGENEGSWDPDHPVRDDYASEGRLYVTCLSIYILEVYYRYLPIYRSSW